MTVDGNVRARRGLRLGVTAVLAASLLAGACKKSDDGGSATGPTTTVATRPHTKGPADGAKAKDGGKLVMAIENDAEGLDPTRYAFAASGHFIASAVFDALATLDDNGKAVPYLASDIKGSDGNKTWTLTIPDGITFSDGDPLDADVVLQNFQAHQNSLITKAALVTVESIEKTSKNTVTVKLTKPWAAFPTLMMSQVGYVISPKMLANPDLNRTPIGSGPFVYDSRVDGDVWKFKKNPKYRQPGKPHLDAIEFRIVQDETKRVSMLSNGEADMIHSYKPDQVLALRAGDYKLVDYAEGEEDFIVVNHARPPFDNLNARLAVAYATNTEGWRKEVTKDIEQPANSPFAPGQLGYEADNGYPKFDLAKAKEYVQKYEKETGKKLEFQFILIDNPEVLKDGQYFQKDWESLGMKVSIQSFKQIGLVAQTALGNFDLAIFRNFGFRDPDSDVVFWRSTSAAPMGQVALNFPRFKSDKVDAAIDKATAATSDSERDAAYKEISREFAAQIPYIWMGRPNWVLAATTRVNGIYTAANGSIQTLGAKTWLADLWIA